LHTKADDIIESNNLLWSDDIPVM